MEKTDRAQTCLIHCITNPISINQTANAVLALGAKPIMAEHPLEVEEITKTASALLINLGNISDVRMTSMKISLKAANNKGIPVVLDAVGCACSELRKSFVKDLISEGRFAVIKGNYSEILAIGNDAYKDIGVDAKTGIDEESVRRAILKISADTNAIVLATGKTDFIGFDGSVTEVNGGTEMLSSVTGTGCILGAVIATYLARENTFKSVVDACGFFKKCGEDAARIADGTGTFMVKLIDAMSEKKISFDPTMYFITDSTLYEEDEFLARVKSALEGGVTLIQLREKNRSTRDYIDLAKKVHALTSEYNVPLIIDDRVDVMLASGAEGVHVGAEDMPVKQARKIIGNNKILGATAKTVEAALKAYEDGADYLGVGAIYPTTTKVKTVLTSTETLDAITKAVPIPVNAIGGLNSTNLGVLKGIDIAGICAVSAIMKAEDPKLAAEELKDAFEDLRRSR